MTWLGALGASWVGAFVMVVIAYHRAPTVSDEPTRVMDLRFRDGLPAASDPLVEVRSLGANGGVEPVARQYEGVGWQ